MELLKLSKFRVQLQALISEVKQLREREIFANDQIRVLTQKQKQREEEFTGKLNELQAELGLSNDIRKKLEKKVSCLESENELLDNKQKELGETIGSLLQSKQSFSQVYEDSFGEMKRAVEDRDRKNAVLSEKIKAYSLLFDTIEKEANSIKQVVATTDRAIKEREEVVVGIKRKFDEISTQEKLFFGSLLSFLQPFVAHSSFIIWNVATLHPMGGRNINLYHACIIFISVKTSLTMFLAEKITNLERKLRDNENELRRKDKLILSLEAQLEAANLSFNFQPKVDELQNALSAKEIFIQNLILEKQALHFEAGNLSLIMKKIQDAVSQMDEENRKSFSSILDEAEECVTIRGNEVKSLGDVQEEENGCHQNTSTGGVVENSASPECEKFSLMNLLKENIHSCVSEAACSPSQSASSQSRPQFATNAVNLSTTEAKDESTKSVDQLDSECSRTTQAGNY